MSKIHGHHLLFGATLVTLFALSGWWVVLFGRSVKLERDAKLGELRHAAIVHALTIGHRTERPRPGLVPGPDPIEIAPITQGETGGILVLALPRHPDLGVRPTPESIAAIETKARRRRMMFLGEGMLLFATILVCTSMLYFLIHEERRQARHMEDFVSAVTHEMKTPLTGIKSLLQTFAEGRVPPDQQALLCAMGLKEAERLEHTVENVLISGHLRTARYRIFPESIELGARLEGFVEHRRRYLVGSPESVRLVWEAGDEPVTVTVDASALTIILENLVDNAFKYGGDSPTILVRARRQEGRIAVAVEDSGIGFDPETVEELFTPYRRATAGQVVQHGTGLGLPIARTLARRMGGDLTGSSEGPGKGSRFTVFLKEATS